MPAATIRRGPAVHPVRMPGEGGLKKRRDQLADGVMLNPEIMPALEALGEEV